MNFITAEDLKKKLDNDADIQIIDVREDYEFEEFNLGGINIPLENVLTSIDKIDKDRPVVFCCRTGKRSAAIMRALIKKHQIENLLHLKGGFDEYQEKINS